MASELQELKKKLRDQRKASDQAEVFTRKYNEVLMRSRTALTSLLSDVKDVLDMKETSLMTSSSTSPPSTPVKKEDVKAEVNGE